MILSFFFVVESGGSRAPGVLAVLPLETLVLCFFCTGSFLLFCTAAAVVVVVVAASGGGRLPVLKSLAS